MNLLTETTKPTLDYFCTWQTQGFWPIAEAYRRGETDINFTSTISVRDTLTEESVFGENGMIHQLKDVRQHLFFVFDDGWDVPFGLTSNTPYRPLFGSLEVNESRFPSIKGTLVQKLNQLNNRVKAHGWRGAGLWIAAQAAGEYMDHLLSPQELEDYWRDRLLWSHQAGIGYWKVDWGRRERQVDFRAMLTRLGHEVAPGLIIEHAGCCPGLNNEPDSDGRFLTWGKEPEHWRQVFAYSDVFRSYDVLQTLSTITTIDRVTGMLSFAPSDQAQQIINCEDELYLGAALGCSVGIMRSSINDQIPADLKSRDPRQCGKKMQEAVRTVRWHGVAPAFGAGEAPLYASDEILEVSRFLSDKEVWTDRYKNRTMKQGCPAIVSRGMPLPKVEYPEKEKPFVVAAKNPNGAVSLAVLPCTTWTNRYETPLVHVHLPMEDSTKPIGLFGDLGGVTLHIAQNIAEMRLWAQDLADDSAFDITEEVDIVGNNITITRYVLRKYGLKAADPDDQSEPGLMLCLHQPD